MKHFILAVALIALIISPPAAAQKNKKEASPTDTLKSSLVSGIKWRGIGPAFASGRIADFAVNPANPLEYYVAVAAGNVWKTENSGITWKPIFDQYGSWSIADVEMDPSNPSVIWVGTGEYNSQRAIGYGDGVYKSEDGGASFKNMGLKNTKHIGRILIDPRDGNVVYVAAQGPLWGPGGERGLYKTIDGGRNWNKILDISENTGITDIVADPRNPDILYTAAYQRRRHVWTLVNGGPESAIYKSDDAGKTWSKLTKGLPGGDVGRIGLAISPVNPDYVYAIIEAEEESGGFFRTTNRGASWEKMSSHVSPSPQYYNRIFCDPKDVDKVFSVETVTHLTTDGGRNWKALGLNKRHVDDHALWINPANTNHLLIGGDGGIYESFDHGEHWDFKENLPVTQFYRVSTDNSEPFYYVYGGTQDNNSMGGPSQTTRRATLSDDWFVTNGGDGFETVIDPCDQNIVYAQSQYGGLVRYDRRTEEAIDIQPQPPHGESYRWNWNSPLIASPHHPHRLYFAANKLFRSDDRGNSWEVVSPDLTRQLDRNLLPVFGKIQSPEAVAKNASTSYYGNIVALDESPVKEGLLYTGTDDGLIQVSENGGISWTRYENFPGIPANTYVAFVLASQHNENVVYACFDARKQSNLKPYVLRSNDKGKTWQSITANLPERGTVYCIAEDHTDPGLLFVGTEFSVFFTANGGNTWTKIASGLPTTCVMDMAIQKRENDLVVATFGRGFYILEDYSPLRGIDKQTKDTEARLFPVKDALAFVRTGTKYGQGSTYYLNDNPPVAATFTYYLKEIPQTLKQKRREEEKKARAASKDIAYPDMLQLKAEDDEEKPVLLFTIRDEEGQIVRKIRERPQTGIQRVRWDLRHSSVLPFRTGDNEFANAGSAMLVPAGKYAVEMALVFNDSIRPLAGLVDFMVKHMAHSTLTEAERLAYNEFHARFQETARVVLGAFRLTDELETRVRAIRQAVAITPGAPFALEQKVKNLQKELGRIQIAFGGDPAYAKRNENQPPALRDRINGLIYSHWSSTSAPTLTMQNEYKTILAVFSPLHQALQNILQNDIPGIEAELDALKAPYTPGRLPGFSF